MGVVESLGEDISRTWGTEFTEEAALSQVTVLMKSFVLPRCSSRSREEDPNGLKVIRSLTIRPRS
jgi:hypothetical protein